MDAYIYKAALYCENCSQEIDAQIGQCGDADHCVQGPYVDGGGEADTPQHCDTCGMFLENPLTSDGIDYVRSQLDGPGETIILKMWSMFYANSL